LDEASAQQLLARLEDLIRELDPDADEVARALSQKIDSTSLQPLMQELVSQLSDFDFDAAGKTLKQLKHELKASA
jgi:hypothetical protein